jgi:5-(carboxyamino)imidazole ribonucleotide mutase
MPAGIPVLTVAIGVAGAKNAALAAIAMLAVHDEQLSIALQLYREEMAVAVRKSELI